jgi:hypothetical protein
MATVSPWCALLFSHQQEQIPPIVLQKETPKKAVCQVIERASTGRVSRT